MTSNNYTISSDFDIADGWAAGILIVTAPDGTQYRYDYLDNHDNQRGVNTMTFGAAAAAGILDDEIMPCYRGAMAPGDIVTDTVVLKARVLDALIEACREAERDYRDATSTWEDEE